MTVAELILYIALVPIHMDGVHFAPGKEMALSSTQALPLLQVNAIELKTAADASEPAEDPRLRSGDGAVAAVEHRRVLAASDELLMFAQQALDDQLELHEKALATIDTLTQANAALQAQLDAAARSVDASAAASSAAASSAEAASAADTAGARKAKSAPAAS